MCGHNTTRNPKPELYSLVASPHTDSVELPSTIWTPAHAARMRPRPGFFTHLLTTATA